MAKTVVIGDAEHTDRIEILQISASIALNIFVVVKKWPGLRSEERVLVLEVRTAESASKMLDLCQESAELTVSAETQPQGRLRETRDGGRYGQKLYSRN